MKRPLKPAGFPISQIHSFENFLETLTSVKMSDKLAFLSVRLTKLKMSDFQTQCLTYGNYFMKCQINHSILLNFIMKQLLHFTLILSPSNKKIKRPELQYHIQKLKIGWRLQNRMVSSQWRRKENINLHRCQS